MNPGAILISLAILIVAATYVITPLVNAPKRQTVSAAPAANALKDERKDSLAAIRDLDFDFQTGKVTQEDYEALRAQLVLQAANFLQQRQQVDEKIEEMISARLQSKKESAFKEPIRAYCPHCGKRVMPGDLFCTACGTRLNEMAVSNHS